LRKRCDKKGFLRPDDLEEMSSNSVIRKRGDEKVLGTTWLGENEKVLFSLFS
jgi:hypothetical protein